MKKIKINLLIVSLLVTFSMGDAIARTKKVVRQKASVQKQSSEYVYADTNNPPVAADSSDQWEEVASSDGQLYDDQVAGFDPLQQAPTAKEATSKSNLSTPELGERLLTAARDNKLGDVRWLLRKGADPEYKAHANALSPLDLVVKGGWVDVAKVFQEEGISFDKKGDLGVTFLHQAAAAGRLTMVKFLVATGISPNVTTDKGWTPLHHAARFGHAQVVDYLLKAGASAEERNSDGFRPRELAINARHPKVLQLL